MQQDKRKLSFAIKIDVSVNGDKGQRIFPTSRQSHSTIDAYLHAPPFLFRIFRRVKRYVTGVISGRVSFDCVALSIGCQPQRRGQPFTYRLLEPRLATLFPLTRITCAQLLDSNPLCRGFSVGFAYRCGHAGICGNQ